MLREYTKEEIWKLYKELPPELKEAVFSEETAENIGNICERNGVEKVSEVARLTGRVLLGILPPAEFGDILEKEIGLEPETARRTHQEIFRFVFFPVKNLLEELYRVEIEAPVRPIAVPEEPRREATSLTEKEIEERAKKAIERDFENKEPEQTEPEREKFGQEESKQRGPAEDVYRESIE